MKTNFQKVVAMNIAFGNPGKQDLSALAKQCLNIADELGELFVALGSDVNQTLAVVGMLKEVASRQVNHPKIELVRDALTDIQVFAYGGQHFLGADGDTDMDITINNVMTRFIKDEADEQATIAMHAAKGITQVYFEGTYPTKVMKSLVDQPDAPKGKFLKSASHKVYPFPPL